MSDPEFSIEKFSDPLNKHFTKWIRDLNEELKNQPDAVKSFINRLYETDKIFVCGRGRSELIGIYSGIRMRHAGYDVYRVGDFFTPPIGKKGKDIMLCISGSGETNFVVNNALVAKKSNIPILSVTSKPDSSLGVISDEKIIIKGRTKQAVIKNYDVAQLKEPEEPISYLGSEFESKAYFFLEITVNYLAKRKGISEKDMRERHLNLEG